MKRDRRYRIAVRRANHRIAGTARRSPARQALWLPLLVALPATLQAGSPIHNSFGDLNAHLGSHGAAVRHANAPAQTGGHHDPNAVLSFARQYLSLRLDLPLDFDPGGGPQGGGLGGSGGLGGNLATDLFVQQQVAIENWAPGGANFPTTFNDRGTLVAQDGSVVITPTSSWQIGNFNLQTAAINGQYSYVNDIDAPHGANVHAPFDITAGASGSADTTTDTSEVRVDLQWVGIYSHPEEAYDPPQGGGYAPPIGAVDFFTFDIQGNAAAQYFNPVGAGGSNQPPGLPDLPELPDLPQFNNDTLPNELTGLNPYGPSYTNSSNNPGYNPYNPTRYTNPDYNPYNPNGYTNPGYNPYNPSAGTNGGYNPYLASSPYNAQGAPDNSALLTAYGGSASNVNNPSQFDHTWLTAIEQEHGVQHYQDYGSFSSASSAALRGIVRPVQLTAVNQQDLAAYIAATGITPSTIGSQVNVLDSTPGGMTSFASLDDYDERRNGSNKPPSGNQSNPNPFGYNTFAGSNPGSNASREPSYQGGGNTGSSAPPGYNTTPLFTANNPGGNRIGSFNTASSYDDNTQGNLTRNASGYNSPSGDVVSYGGATGYDGYDSSAARELKQAEIDSALAQEREQVAEIEERERIEKAEEAMQDLTQSALELASLGPSTPAPGEETTRKPTNTKIVEIAPGVYVTIQDDSIEEVAPGQYKDKEVYDPAFDVPDDIEEQYREQQENRASEETAEKTIDEDFEERFGSVEDGGYDFDNPRQDPNAGPEEKSPRDQAWDYYGDEITSRGWEQYKDVPASEFNSLPSWVRDSDLFQNYKLYEYVLQNPNASPEEFGRFYRGLTGTQYDNDYVDTLLLETLNDYRDNPSGWGAAGKGIVGGLNGIVEQLKALEASLPTGMARNFSEHLGKMAVMSPEERERYVDQVVLAPLRDKVDAANKVLDAIDYLSDTDLATKRADLAKFYDSVRQDLLKNPEKYVEGGFELALTLVADYAIGKGSGLVGKGKLDLPGTDGPGKPRNTPDLADNNSGTNTRPQSNPSTDGTSGTGIGEKIGEGKTSDVYKGDDGTVVKVLKPGQGDEAFDRMVESYRYIENHDDIPKVEILSYTNDANGRRLIIEDLNSPKWQNKDAYLLGDGRKVSDLEAAAVQELGQNLLDKGLMWADPNKGNVFFFKDANGNLKAGIIDHDFIAPVDQLRRSATPGAADLPDSVIATSGQFQAIMGTPELIQPYMKWISSGTPESASSFYSAWIEAKLGRL